MDQDQESAYLAVLESPSSVAAAAVAFAGNYYYDHLDSSFVVVFVAAALLDCKPSDVGVVNPFLVVVEFQASHFLMEIREFFVEPLPIFVFVAEAHSCSVVAS